MDKRWVEREANFTHGTYNDDNQDHTTDAHPIYLPRV